MPTFFYTSEMVGGPTNTHLASSTLEIINACLVTGFNPRTVSSASVTAGVMTIVYATSHGYTHRVWIQLEGAAGGTIVRSANVTSSTQLTILAPSFADGPVAGTLVTRVAPADWERVFSGTNIGVFRSKVIGPGSSRMFYRIADTVVSSQPNLLRGYESMTDASTGSGPFPTFAQQTNADGMQQIRSNSATARPWMVVADERTAYMAVQVLTGVDTYWMCVGDGRPYNLADPFCAFAMCGSTALPNSALRLSDGSNVAGSFSPRAINGLGSAIQAAGIDVAGNNSGAGGREYPSPVDGGVVMIRPVPLCAGSSSTTSPIRGEMRGLLHLCANPLPANSFWQIFEPVTGVTGRVLVARDGVSNCIGFAIDEVWA